MQIRFEAISGNETVKELLAHQIKLGKAAHAYLIEGEKGSGKTALATEIAKALCCQHPSLRPCGSCAFCRKIDQGLTPDVISLAPLPDRKQISVDQVRALRQEAYLTATELPYKIFMVEAADEMNGAAQNALLKVLEEPPAGVLFLLMTARPGAILPTIRSRTQSLKTELLSRSALSEYLCARLPEGARLKARDPEAYDRILKRSGGSVGRAITLLTGRRKAFDPESMARELLTLLTAHSHTAFLSHGAFALKDREQWDALLSALLCALRDLMARKKAPGTPCLFFEHPEQADDIAEKLTWSALLALYDLVLKASSGSAENLNMATAQLMLCEQAWIAKSRLSHARRMK